MSIEIKSDILVKELNQGIVPLGVPKAYQYDAALVEAARAAVNQGLDDVAEAGATAVTSVKAQESTSTTNINTLGDKILAQMKHGYGYPFTAATVAAMTDTAKIYVYTGSETGYTNGNWYYWNGTAWTSGGVYNATALETDKALTVSGAAADAKATGTSILVVNNISKTISKAVIGNQYDEYRIYINGFVNKTINATTGEPASDLSTRASTYNIIGVQPFSEIYITIKNGYRCELFQYLNNIFVKKTSITSQIKLGNVNGIRLLVYKVDATADISIEEAENAIVAYDNVLKIESVNGGNYFNPLTTENGYLNFDGTLASGSYKTSFFIDTTNISTLYATVDVRKM